MKMIQILNILEKYFTDSQKEYPFWAEHDIIGFNVDYEIISKEDLKILEKLSVFINDEYNSLTMDV